MMTLAMWMKIPGLIFSLELIFSQLVEQNRINFIPPTSRMTNYVLLKFGELSQTM
ncbi:hypothetical protein CsatA_010657 [Cannabis sativa]